MVSKVHFAHWHWQLSPLPFLEKLTCWSQGGRFTHQLEWFKYISLLFTRFELNDIPLADTTILVRRILRTRMGLHKIQVVCLWLSGRLGEETGWLKRRSPTLTEHTSNIAQILSIIPDVSNSSYARSSSFSSGLFCFAPLQRTYILAILRLSRHRNGHFYLAALRQITTPCLMKRHYKTQPFGALLVMTRLAHSNKPTSHLPCRCRSGFVS